MKHSNFLNQSVQVCKKIGKESLSKPIFGTCTEVTKEHVQVEINLLNGLDRINFLKRNGYFDYRGGRYLITTKNT